MREPKQRGVSLRERITDSWQAPVVALLVLLLVWWLRGGSDVSEWAALPAVLVCTLGMRRLAAENALVRVRTWLPTTLFVLLMALPEWLQEWGSWQLAVLAYGLSLYWLMQSYESPCAERGLLLAGGGLGVACVVYPSLLLLVVVYLISMSVHLQVFRLRALSGFVIGLVVPLLLCGSVCMAFDRWDVLAGWVGELGEVGFVGNELLPQEVALLSLYWLLLYATAAVHYVLNCFDDKIRTRMCLYVLILQCGVLLVLLFLQAGHYRELSAMLAVGLAPLLGHYVALSRGRWNGVWVLVLLALYVALLVLPQTEWAALLDGMLGVVD